MADDKDIVLGPDDCAIVFRSDGTIHVIMSLRETPQSRVSRAELQEALTMLGISKSELEPLSTITDDDTEDELEGGVEEEEVGEGWPPKPSGGHLN